MRIVYIQTYPIYHDGLDTTGWLRLENRDKWMAGITASLGIQTEIWCAGMSDMEYAYKWSDSKNVPVRVFKSNQDSGKTKRHFSDSMLKHARETDVDWFILKGVDGGVGLHLLKRHIIPRNIPFMFVIGGKFKSSYNKHARAILCETDEQKTSLESPSFWEKRLKGDVHILPKSVDTDLFRPDLHQSKKWDVLIIGRLIPYYKDYSALAQLSRSLKVAVIGSGPQEAALKKAYPDVDWLGHIPHRDLPAYMASSRCLFHTSQRDFFPRVIPEAAACGLPVVAFKSAIKPDVLPDSFGLRLEKKNVSQQITEWLADVDQHDQRSHQARLAAVTRWHKESTRPILTTLFG